METKLKELRAEAQELIDLGDSHEKREGYGMLKVIDALTEDKDYFQIVANGYNKELQREEIQIHCGENGNLMLVKTDEGFVVDAYGQNDIVGTMAIWEDQLTPDTEEEKKWIRMADDSNDGDDDDNLAEPTAKEVDDFIDEWGQTHDEICANLGYDVDGSDDLLMVDYFWDDHNKRWYPTISSLYTKRDQVIADYMRTGEAPIEEGYTWELCPHCDTEVKLKNEFCIQQCPNCKMPILPCSICTHGTDEAHTTPCDCSTCPLEANVREQYIDKLMSTMYKGDDPKYDESTRNYLRGMSTQTLIEMMEDSFT